jgi:uncharacterized protein
VNILLTGATGLVGRSLGVELVAAGHRVFVISRRPEVAVCECPFPASHFAWDQVSKVVMLAPDVVIHLAGEPVAGGLWTKSRRQGILDSRVESTKKLVQAFQKVGKWPKVWINASAIGFYGERGDEWLGEDARSGSGFLADVCRQWEGALSDIPAECRTVRLRTGVVLAHRGGALDAMMPVFRLGLGGPLGSGKQWMSWIHERDLRRLILFCIENQSLSGAVNAVSPAPVSNLEFTKALNKRLRRRGFLPVPAILLKCLGGVSSMFLDSQRVSSKRAEAAGFHFEFRQLDHALKDVLDFQMRPGVFEIFQAQWVPKPIDEMFQFFCNENNLETLTPEMLNFKVIGKNTDQIKEGTLIDYRLKIRGVPARWRTKITMWQPGVKFVDIQIKGPYTLWHHTHEFTSLGEGTLMTDRVLYKPPFWPGSFFVMPMLRADVRAIFAFRRKAIIKLFGPHF